MSILKIPLDLGNDVSFVLTETWLSETCGDNNPSSLIALPTTYNQNVNSWVHYPYCQYVKTQILENCLLIYKLQFLFWYNCLRTIYNHSNKCLDTFWNNAFALMGWKRRKFPSEAVRNKHERATCTNFSELEHFWI